MGEVLFIGPSESGKSLLLKRMRTLAEVKKVTPFDPIPSIEPTQGTSIVPFKFRSANYIFKELGGGSISEWSNHAASALAIVYVFDSADLTRTASNLVWLSEILYNKDMESKPILVVLAKCDVPGGVRFDVIDEIIGCDYVLNPSRLKFIEASSVMGIGLTDIFGWIGEHLT
jgi:GTPase SAR1 family protein